MESKQMQVSNDCLSDQDDSIVTDDENTSQSRRESEISVSGPSIADLQARCEFLLNELRGFAHHIRKLGREHTVELRGPSGAVEAELKSLKKLSETRENIDVRERTLHILRSSNIPYHEAVWATAKRCSGVIAFNKRFFWRTPSRAQTRNDLKTKFKQSALVDIVASNGEEWIKVSTITETRLLFELAKQGWDSADESSGSEEDASSRSSPSRSTNQHNADDTEDVNGNDVDDDDDDDDEVSILKMARDLAKAAPIMRVRYKTPRIRFVLPKVQEGRLKEIDRLISQIRKTGATVETNVCIDVTQPDLASALPTMLVDEFADFSDTLNVDCTILLALVSDLSHAHIDTKPWFPRATTRQIEMEEKETLLPSSLYPAMGSHALVCTTEAAVRMREIVATIGTPTEKARTALLMGDDPSLSQPDLVAAFRKLSEYHVPDEWQLPVRVVDQDDTSNGFTDRHPQPPEYILEKVAERLSAINCSVFLYGWRSGRTTITSNRTVARQIEETVEANRAAGDAEDIIGPPLWLCPMARSLVGKEKNRRGVKKVVENGEGTG